MQTHITHGGDWAGFQQAYGRLPLDFSINLNPLGTPPGVREALRAAADHVDRYPDPLCRELRTALSRREGAEAAHILCGNGAADLIFRLAAALRPKQALVTAPTFGEYAAALRCVGCSVARYALRCENGFAVQEDILEAIVPGIGLVVLCEPNNPTGVTTPRRLLLRILERCRAVGAYLLVDECFGEFLDDPAAHTLMGETERQPGLIILKAFTKLYAMAGARLGYVVCGDPELLRRMQEAAQPWSVSSLAQEAGVAALGEEAYVERSRRLLREERGYLLGELEALGLRVIPGEANYLLFQCGRPLQKRLAERGILVRGCGDYPGLDETWYRTAVRLRGENQQLVLALKEALQ